jgi:hypothetical protein
MQVLTTDVLPEVSADPDPWASSGSSRAKSRDDRRPTHAGLIDERTDSDRRHGLLPSGLQADGWTAEEFVARAQGERQVMIVGVQHEL